MKNIRRSLYLFLSMSLLFFVSCSTMRQPVEQRTRLTEPRILPLEEPEWNQAQVRMLAPLKPYFKDGRVINVFTTISRNPKLLDSWLPLTYHILYTSTIPAREREILILRIGWLCRSEYEFGQHILVGKRAGLSDEEILRITKGPDATGWGTFDAALIRATDELHRDAFISDETWQALATKYDEKQLLDLIFTVGQYNLVSIALNSCGVQRDPGFPGFPEGAGK